ncbi:MAG: transporter substrate-binding domain-containing protein [Synergistaceae bacterium]|nr:transporter substrate-binding domain-containing protein [Synergistaceae bacterium]
MNANKRLLKLMTWKLALVLLLSASACDAAKFTSFRDIPGVTEDEIRAVEAFQAQGVSFVYGAPPSTETFSDVNGEIRGFTVLLCEWLTELFGIPFEPGLYEWSDMLAGLHTGEIDFTGELTATDERRKTYIMTDAIAGRLTKYIRIAGSPPLSQIAAWRRPRYGFLTGTTTIDNVTALIDYEYETFLLGGYSEAYYMLKFAAIDAFIDEGTAEAAFDFYGDVVAEDFFPLIYEPVSLTTQNPANAPIISVVQKALENNAIRYLTELYNLGMQEYTKHKLFTSLTEEELAYIYNNPVARFAAEYDNYPLSFYSARDGQWQGVCFDVLGEVEALTGLTFELANNERTAWPDLLRMLESGEVSMVSELIRTPEREGLFLWPAIPLLTDNHALLSKAEYPNISINEVWHVNIGLVEDTAHTELFLRWFPNHLSTVSYRSFGHAFAALQRGEVDMVMASQVQLLVLTHYQELVGYKANIVFDYPFESTFGFYKGDAVLCSIVDKALRLIDTRGIARYWTGRTYDYREKVAQSRLPWLIGTIVLLLCVLILSLVFFQWRRRTERLVMESNIRERTLTADNAMLDNLYRMESNLLANISHEISTPLTIMSGYAQQTRKEIENGEVNEETANNLRTIQSEAHRLAELANQILSASRNLQTGIAIAPVKPTEILERAANLCEPVLTKNGNRLEKSAEPDCPAVAANLDIILQVFLNLCINAGRHTKNGVVSITAKRAGGHAKHAKYAEFTVEDNGGGIAPELLPRVFERGFSGDGRSGLGLAICKDVIVQHGGTIDIFNEKGKGARVVFTLPAAG